MRFIKYEFVLLLFSTTFSTVVCFLAMDFTQFLDAILIMFAFANVGLPLMRMGRPVVVRDGLTGLPTCDLQNDFGIPSTIEYLDK